MYVAFKNLCFSLACLLCLIAIPTVANAQATPSPSLPSTSKSQSALTVSPAITEQVTPAGKPKVIVIQVTNITNFPLPISGTVKNFVPLEQLDTTDDSVQSKYDASKWFVISEPDFILQPKQTRPVTITITPPDGAEPGGHYATIYFTPLIPASALTPSTAYLSAQVGTLAFLIVPGKMTEKLSVPSFTTSPIHQSRSIDFALELKNTGSVHLAPNGTIIIKNWRGKTVGSIRPKAGVVLPDTKKSVSATWGGSAFIGKYSATAHMTYGAANTVISPVTVTFWVIPWGVLLGGGIPLVLIGLIAVRTRGRWKKAWQILFHPDNHAKDSTKDNVN